jgi:hypothetical protein
MSGEIDYKGSVIAPIFGVPSILCTRNNKKYACDNIIFYKNILLKCKSYTGTRIILRPVMNTKMPNTQSEEYTLSYMMKLECTSAN